MNKIQLLEFLKRELQYDFGFHEIHCDGLLCKLVLYGKEGSFAGWYLNDGLYLVLREIDGQTCIVEKIVWGLHEEEENVADKCENWVIEAIKAKHEARKFKF